METLKASGVRLLQRFLLIYILVGCAVLNVEVDVYKGPLANHREIQLEQVAAMAVAARPLLLDLSYQLESKWRKENCERNRYAVGSGKTKKVVYRHSYSGRGNLNDGTLRILCEQELYRHSEAGSNKMFNYHFADPGVSHAFLSRNTALDFDPNRYIYGSSEARKVNALLELYQERSPSHTILYQVVKKASLIDDQLARYRSSVPDQFWDDLVSGSGVHHFWQQKKIFNDAAYSALKSCPSPWREPVVKATDDSDIEEKSFNGWPHYETLPVFAAYKKEQLVCGLNDYFNPNKKTGWRIGRRFQRLLYETAKETSEVNSNNEPGGQSNKEKDSSAVELVIDETDSDYFLSTNGTYLWLSEKRNAQKIVDAVINNDCEQVNNDEKSCGRNELVDYITSTARSFIDSRVSLNQLHRFLLLNIKIYSDLNEDKDNQELTELTDSLIDLTKQVLDYSDVLLAFRAISNENCFAIDSCLAEEYANELRKNSAIEFIKNRLDKTSAAECKWDIPFVYEKWRNTSGGFGASQSSNNQATKKQIGGPPSFSIEDKSKVFCSTTHNKDILGKALDASFQVYPTETAELLINLDAFLMGAKIGDEKCYWINGANCTGKKTPFYFQKGPFEHRMGIVAGPNELLRKINDNQSFAGAAKDRLSTFSLGLKEGRRDRGLTDQIEEFLEQRDSIVNRSESFEGQLYENYPQEYKKTKTLLLNSLEEFAQKLLVIANSNQLFSLDQLGDQSTTFQVVLQTVGNSILNYSNDITHYDSHEIRLAKRYELEKNAFTHSLGLSIEKLNSNYEAFLAKSLEEERSKLDAEKDKEELEKKKASYTKLKHKVTRKTPDQKIDDPLAYFERDVGDAYDKLTDSDVRKKGLDLLANFMLSQFEMAVVSRLTLPEQSKGGSKVGDPRSIIDALILSMQYQYLIANLSNNDERKELLKKAIEEAYEHRAGMIYIRPASAYLRSSYSASTLQPDAGSFDRNLLTSKWYASLPIIGGGLNYVINKDEYNFNKVRNDIDKQNWQTVNKIRVKGSGKSNYVLIKDDVGNWYVKNYSDEKAEIIESAKNLLLFSTAGLDIDGLPVPSGSAENTTTEEGEPETGAGEVKPPEVKVAPASTMERFFNRQQASYYERSIDHYEIVKKWYSSGVMSIVAQQHKEGCEEAGLSKSTSEFSFQWLENNKPGKDYKYEDEVPLKQDQVDAAKDIGDTIVSAIRGMVFNMPPELNNALEKSEQLCAPKEGSGSEGDIEEHNATVVANIHESSVRRIRDELIKPFMEKRQAFVREQKSTNLMMQDMLAE